MGGSTFLVIGLARGGTSLAAGLLQAGGLSLGERARSPNYEDARLSSDIRSGRSQELRSTIALYDAAGPWGFKNPICNHFLLRNLDLFRRPRIVYVRKSLDRTARRRSSVYGTPFPYEWALCRSKRLILDRMVRAAACPSLWFSYESFVTSPAREIAALVDFCDFGEEAGAGMLSFSDRGKEAYLQWVKGESPSLLGYVEEISPAGCRGWVFRPRCDNPSQVQVALRGGPALHSTTADRFRPDVHASHPRLTAGHCGFEVTFPAPMTPDQMRDLLVRVDGIPLPLAPRARRSSGPEPEP